MTEPTTEEQMIAQMQDLVEKTIQRSIKGVQYAQSQKVQVGPTPRDCLLDNGTLQLYRYLPISDEVYRVPVLLVMATTNRGYLLDLLPGQSLVEYLLQEGFDVFMIDWEPPVASERELGLKDYTQEFIPACIEKVQAESGEPDVSIVAYCMGGVLSLIYAATHPDGPLKNLACMTTPVDWHEMGLFRIWTDSRFLDVDKLVETLGNIPEEFVASAFEMLRPAARPAGQLRAWNNLWNDDFVRSYRAIDRWSNDYLPLAGEYYRDTVRELLWENKLCRGELVVDGKLADLAQITIPVFNAMAQHDHISPVAAVRPLLDLVGSHDRHEVLLKGGHVSLIAGPNAVNRLWPELNDWLAARSA